jgi:hypothetical protein
MSKKMMNMLLTLLFSCLAFLSLGEFGLRLMLSSPNACLFIARVSVALSPRFAQHTMLFLCRIHLKLAAGQVQNLKQKDIKMRTSTELHEILYTHSQDLLVL